MALDMDSLALVTYTATEVFVTTAFGAGKFSKKAWDAAKAPKNSLEDNGGRAS